MMTKTPPTAKRVRELFNYDPESGHLTFREANPNRKLKAAGTRAGYRDSKGGNRRVSGRMPVLKIIQLDGDKENNRLSNLAERHPTEVYLDSQNKRPNGLPKGVSRSGKRYLSKISLLGREKKLGEFDTPEEAAAKYNRYAEAASRVMKRKREEIIARSTASGRGRASRPSSGSPSQQGSAC